MTETLGEISARYVNEYGFALIPLKPKSKEPATPHGLKDWSNDAESIKEWMESHPKHNLGIVLGEPSGGLVVIDIDVDDDQGYDGMETLRKWEREHGELPETVMANTGRGGTHLYYRVSKKIHPHVNDELHVDIRGDGSYAMLPPSIHPNGNPTLWENYPEDYEIAEADDNVYAFIDYVSGGSNGRKPKYKLPNEIKKNSRNDELFRYGAHLQSMETPDEVIIASLESVNKLLCKPPLPKHEVEKITSSVLNLSKGKSEEVKKLESKGKSGAKRSSEYFNHASFAEQMIEQDHVCFIDGAPAIWTGQSYAIGKKFIEAGMIKRKQSIKARNRTEVYKYLEIMAPHVEAADKRYIAFSNCVLDLQTMKKLEIDPSFHVPNVVPHRWNPEAQSQMLVDTLLKIACEDLGTFSNLLEIIGLCIYRGTELATCPILFGRGQNGKSTYLNMLHRVIGDDNVSSLDVATIGERFQTVPLLGKLANIGDDISNEFVSGSKASVVKKIITGDYIQGEYKGGDSFMFKPYCTLVFSCNDFPRIGDSSYGMVRRLHPVKFGAQFSITDPDYNPYIEDELAKEEVLEAAIVLGINSLKDALKAKSLTKTQASEEQIESIKLANSTVYQFAVDELNFGEVDQVDILFRATSDVYEEYQKYCERMRIRTPVQHTNFTTQMKEIFHVNADRKWLDFADGKKQRRAFLPLNDQ